MTPFTKVRDLLAGLEEDDPARERDRPAMEARLFELTRPEVSQVAKDLGSPDAEVRARAVARLRAGPVEPLIACHFGFAPSPYFMVEHAKVAGLLLELLRDALGDGTVELDRALLSLADSFVASRWSAPFYEKMNANARAAYGGLFTRIAGDAARYGQDAELARRVLVDMAFQDGERAVFRAEYPKATESYRRALEGYTGLYGPAHEKTRQARTALDRMTPGNRLRRERTAAGERVMYELHPAEWPVGTSGGTGMKDDGPALSFLREAARLLDPSFGYALQPSRNQAPEELTFGDATRGFTVSLIFWTDEGAAYLDTLRFRAYGLPAGLALELDVEHGEKRAELRVTAPPAQAAAVADAFERVLTT